MSRLDELDQLAEQVLVGEQLVQSMLSRHLVLAFSPQLLPGQLHQLSLCIIVQEELGQRHRRHIRLGRLCA